MKSFSKWFRQFFIFSLLSVFFLNESIVGADDERDFKRVKLESAVSSSSVPTIIEKEWVLTGNSSLWKSSLNFSYTPYSPPILVDDWHRFNGKIIPALQGELANVSRNANINVAIVGLQCIYREAGSDTIGITKIVNLPKLFVSGCKSPRLSFADFINKACTSLSLGGDTTVQVIKATYNGLYGVGDGYIYSGYDNGFFHLRSYMEQNFNLWLGESSHLSRGYLQSKLQIIKKYGIYKDQFAEKCFHSEQAALAYLASEEGIEFLFECFFNKLPERVGKPHIIQLVLNISSYYDVCESCADMLFRESEVGRMFLRKLEDRLKSQHYLHPHNQLLLFVSTSGILNYKDRVTKAITRPPGFEDGIFFRTPLVSTQNPPYITRMRIGE